MAPRELIAQGCLGALLCNAIDGHVSNAGLQVMHDCLAECASIRALYLSVVTCALSSDSAILAAAISDADLSALASVMRSQFYADRARVGGGTLVIVYSSLVRLLGLGTQRLAVRFSSQKEHLIGHDEY